MARIFRDWAKTGLTARRMSHSYGPENAGIWAICSFGRKLGPNPAELIGLSGVIIKSSKSGNGNALENGPAVLKSGQIVMQMAAQTFENTQSGLWSFEGVMQ